ncbi:MAG TPA: sulfatase-like hydrolase/transferase, partial [Phycisphaerae bacterium]|nr:sulfatase-like hydrolase/transferase [Phycisphaerae bacterium]
FFLSVGFTETHRLASAKGAFALTGPCGDGRYVRPPAPLPDTRQTRDDMADFIESAREYDRGVGMVLDALDQAGLAENTLVINTTDHGVPFPALKCHLTDHGIGVMCILRGPGGFSGGKVCDAMVSQIDLFPTLCELAGLEEPDWLEGRSLAPLARGEIEQVRQAVFSEVTYHAAYEPQRCVRTQRWKYIRRYGDRVKPVLSNMDEGLSKSYLREHGLADRTIAQEQLYDLCFDPNEVNNLAGDPARASVLEEMRNRLAQWMEATSDPLLQGPVPAPAGAIVSSQDDATPDDVDNRRKKKG